jgi:ribosome recycling factor
MVTVEDVLGDTDAKMRRSVAALTRELNSVRTGRASPALVENLMVDYYGVPTPLNQLSSISVPEARVLLIQPWDKGSLKDVEKSILTSNLGLVPNNDGNSVRVNIPILTEERRRELVRIVGRVVEDSLVSVRNIRREGLERLRRLEKDKLLSQDDGRRAQDRLQQLTDAFSEQMAALKSEKEDEVMEV